MAKVLLSIPDSLLEEIDAQAKVLGETRSGYLRQLAEEDLEDLADRQAEVKRLMALIHEDAATYPEPMRDAAEMIREDRDSR
jgi:metal-responsive CopG/Arc/MetJ family transcriptional regulator